MIEEIEPDQKHHAQQNSSIPPSSMIVYSFDAVGLHGIGFVMPQSLADFVERVVNRFGFNHTAAAFSIAVISLLLLAFCFLSFLCNIITTATSG